MFEFTIIVMEISDFTDLANASHSNFANEFRPLDLYYLVYLVGAVPQPALPELLEFELRSGQRYDKPVALVSLIPVHLPQGAVRSRPAEPCAELQDKRLYILSKLLGVLPDVLAPRKHSF